VLPGNVTDNAALVFNRSDSVTYAGTISGTGILTQMGPGTLTLTGAGSSIGILYVAAGSVTVGGGTLTLTDTSHPFAVGGSSPTTLTISGGAVVTGNSTSAQPYIDGPAGTAAVVTGTGSQLNSGQNIYLGYYATGSLTVQNGGSVTVNHDLLLGLSSGSTGTLTVQSGGTVMAHDIVYIGGYDTSGTIGTVTVTGAGSQLSGTNAILVGNAGIGTLTVQNGGTAVTPNDLVIGYAPGSTGTMTVTGAGSTSNCLYVLAGYQGSGILTVQSGGTLTCQAAFVGADPGSTGAITVTGTGSVFSVANVVEIGLNAGASGGTGQLIVANGGSAVTTFTTYIGTSASSITVSGGTLTTGGLVSYNGATPSIFLSDPAGGPALTVGTGNTSSTYAGSIADATGGPGTVNKVGTGTLFLTGHLTNSGGYTATAGKIDFSGALVQPGSGSLTAAAGATIQYDTGARVFGGFLYGPGTHVVTGGATFTGTTAFSGAVIDVTGPASFLSFTNGGSLSFASGLATPTVLNGFSNEGSGSITMEAGSTASAAAFQSYGLLTLNPGSSSSAPTLLTNTGSSPLYFNGGSRTFIGTPQTAIANGQPTFLAGIDLHGHNAEVAGGLFVNNGFVDDSTNNGLGTATVVADFGALVKGAGYYQNTVITQNGGKFQAGNSPGSATFGNFVFGPGGVGNYVFAIDDATGTAGPHPNAAGQVSGWGLVSAVRQQMGSTTTPGNFTWTATAADPLTVAIDTLINPTTVGADVAGPMADFDPTRVYSWLAAQWAGTYSGPADAATLNADTAFDTSGFVNQFNGTFGWSLDPADQTLSLTYTPTPVPEPGTLALVGLAAAGLARWRRRGQRVFQPYPEVA
jgi:fibronectin-binding autotransporter adhesin